MIEGFLGYRKKFGIFSVQIFNLANRFFVNCDDFSSLMSIAVTVTSFQRLSVRRPYEDDVLFQLKCLDFTHTCSGGIFHFLFDVVTLLPYDTQSTFFISFFPNHNRTLFFFY